LLIYAYNKNEKANSSEKGDTGGTSLESDWCLSHDDFWEEHWDRKPYLNLGSRQDANGSKLGNEEGRTCSAKLAASALEERGSSRSSQACS
jgi:hypothetical protein